jgi:hypothetical protein
MSKKSRIKRQKVTVEIDDDFDDLYDSDFDFEQLSRDDYDDDGNEIEERTRRGSKRTARWKIERRRDKRKLYSQLNDWEEFGSHHSW